MDKKPDRTFDIVPVRPVRDIPDENTVLEINPRGDQSTARQIALIPVTGGEAVLGFAGLIGCENCDARRFNPVRVKVVTGGNVVDGIYCRPRQQIMRLCIARGGKKAGDEVMLEY